MNAMTTTKKAPVSETAKRRVACPKCGADAGKPCKGSRIPGANSLGGGWGGPPSLDRAHDERRDAWLAYVASAPVPVMGDTVEVVKGDGHLIVGAKGRVLEINADGTRALLGAYGTTVEMNVASLKVTAEVPNAPKVKPRTATIRGTSTVVTLAPRTETGWVPCTGEAHSNAFIDHCMVCLGGRWGEVMSYAPLTPEACKEGFAVSYNAGDREAFEAAEKAGAVELVRLETKSTSFSAWIAKGCVAHSDCAETPVLGQACAKGTVES